MSELVIIEAIERGLTVVTLHRPERRNALSISLLEALCSAIKELESDHSQRVIILRGAGPVFSAGLDLKEAADTALVEKSAQSVERALRLLHETSLVTIAAVQGGAYAGGAGIMAACDLAIATESARIGFPEGRRGLLPALICAALRHKVREGDLRELFLVGEDISAKRARQCGLVQRVVPDSDLLQTAVAVARAILRGGPETIRKTKALLNSLYASDSAAQALADVHLEARHSDEAREGLAAFIEKREPNWNPPG